MLSVIMQYIWFFFAYAFLGWCTEVVFATCARGGFENRGFLNGPLCPIYGFGIVAVVLCLKPLEGSFWLLFAGSAIVTSVLELITGYLMEKIFKHRWWDYSNMPLNIKGYICLPFSLAWGLVCVVLVKFIHPAVAFVTMHIPSLVSYIVLPVLLALFIADTIATSSAIFHFNRVLGEIEHLASQMHQISDELGKRISESASKVYNSEKVQQKKADLESLRLRFNEKINGMNFMQRRLVRAFPKMRSTRHSEAFEKVREALRRKKSQ